MPDRRPAPQPARPHPVLGVLAVAGFVVFLGQALTLSPAWLALSSAIVSVGWLGVFVHLIVQWRRSSR